MSMLASIWSACPTGLRARKKGAFAPFAALVHRHHNLAHGLATGQMGNGLARIV